MFNMKKGLRTTLLIVSAVVMVLIIVVNILARSMFYDLFCLLLDRPKPIYADGVVNMYVPETESKADAFNKAAEKNIEVAKEGFVLLKNKDNNALPLSKNINVSVFGKNSVNLAYSGSGSGGFVVNPGSALYKRMSGMGIDLSYRTIFDALDGYCTYNPKLKSFYEGDKSGEGRSNANTDLDSGDDKVFTVGETPLSLYTDDVKNSYSSYNDVAIVVITRIGGEGADLPRHQGNSAGAATPDSNYLELDKNEIDMLGHVADSGFGKIVVLLNIPSAMEADFLFDTEKYSFADKIDAAMWIGFTGKQGIMALSPLLFGEVSPSGKTVDTWATDLLSDPSSINFGTGITQEQVYSPVTKQNQAADRYFDKGLYYFVNYEEGVYVGYRYYETRGFTDGEEWYKANVTFPFGFGLSYTKFDWTVKSTLSTFTKESTITIEVEVKNTGSVAGKDVVQIYASAPYTAGQIEKPHKVLVGFAKTKLLQPNETDTVSINIDPYDFASYDDRDWNENGFSGYELEKGSYDFYVSRDAHNSESKLTATLADDVRFDKDTTSGETVGNRYISKNSVTATDLTNVTDIDKPLDKVLRRSDWVGTWPTAITDADRTPAAGLIDELGYHETNNPNDYYDDTKYDFAYFDEPVTVKIRDLLPTETPNTGYKAFVSYDDERWNALVSACNADDLIKFYNQAAYQTRALEKIGMPSTLQADGPSGYTCFLNQEQISGTNQYCSEPVFSSTWNQELIEELGKAIGEEGIWGYDQTGQPFSAIYAPGVNIHRSQFGGRCSEYFSEDPFITGKIAAAEIRGLQSKGIIPMIKHFAANEQETHRSINGDCSWLTEQSLREIYLKAFEIAIKDGECRGLMTSFNRIGSMWTGGDYRLCTEILRDEWGFRGTIICDFNTCPYHMFGNQMAYAGGDLNLQTTGGGLFNCDPDNNGDAVVLQNAIKNTLYAMVNSNAMNGEVIGYHAPVWITIMTVVSIVLGVASVGVIVISVISIVNARKKG